MVYLDACDRCGHPLEPRNCKEVCPRCGARLDCSDVPSVHRPWQAQVATTGADLPDPLHTPRPDAGAPDSE